MKWDCHVYNPSTQKTTCKVLEYPKTTKADQGAVARMAARDLGVKSDYVLAVPHRG